MTAKQNNAEKASDSTSSASGIDFKSIILLLLIAILVFAVVFYFLRPKPTSIAGITVNTDGDPAASIAAALPQKVVLAIDAANESELIPCRQLAAAQFALALGRQGKNVTAIGSIAGGAYCIDQNKTRVDCGAPNVIVRLGGSDALTVSKTGIVVEGSDAWLCNNAQSIYRVVSYALSQPKAGQ